MDRVAKGICTVFLLVVAGMYLRAWFESSSWLERSKAERARGEIEQAISSSRRSISWIAPLLPYSNRAYDELQSIAAESTVAAPLRTLAKEEAKRGLSASRSFLDPLNGRSSRVTQISAELDSAVPKEQKSDAVYEMMPPHTNYFFQLLAQGSFFGWVLMVLAIIWLGIDRSGRFCKRPLVLASAGWVALFSTWLVALRLA